MNDAYRPGGEMLERRKPCSRKSMAMMNYQGYTHFFVGKKTELCILLKETEDRLRWKTL